MSVKRFRDISEMPQLPRLDPSSPATHARIQELWSFSSRLLPLFHPGVYRFRSIEESDAARDRAVIERMRAIRASRRR